ncbi:RING/FYVE/PHD zinc finger superfamily protein [Raphanus sativus]|nr:RING/FYVE/PHD zinc finger superfamily protein [Raphanus sativus]
MNEYSSLPPQIAEWYWCIEYVAKFHKDLPCILDLMNMGYPSTNDYGSRINEILSLRILEFLFDPTKNIDSTATVGPRIEFDFSLTNTHVLHAILKHMNMPELPNLFSICTVVSELRPGMPELSTFNILPFIAHKNMSLPLCALEKLRDVIAMENNRTSAAASPPTVDPVYYRDDHQPEQQTRTGLEQTNKDEVVVMDDDDHQPEQQAHTGLELTNKDEVVVMDDDDHQPEQQAHTGLELTNKDEVVVMDDDDHQPEQQAHTGLEQTDKDEVIVVDDDDQVQTTEGDEVIVTDGNHTSAQQPPPISNNCRETSSSPSSGVRVKCTKDGAWLICGSDDDLDTDLVNNIPPRPENDLCWKCKRQGGSSLLLTCSRSECATKVHKECLDGEAHFDEHDNFLCPFCCYDRMAMEYHECQKLLRCAKKRLLKFLPLLSRASKRLKDDGKSC